MTTYGPNPEHRIGQAAMLQTWDFVTFLHWSYPVDVVQALLPPGLRVETFDDQAWMGLVPFRLTAFGVPMAETNVRTYVMDKSGRRGVWFFSLDAAHLLPVLAARLTYRIPYLWSPSRIEVEEDRRRFTSTRRWPGPAGASATVEVGLGEALAAEALTDHDHFLTARWTLFSAARNGLRYANISHEPWTLRRARVETLRQDLIEAAGLPTPTGAPLVHYGERVRVRVGRPRRVSP